jgi:hypothetical protein
MELLWEVYSAALYGNVEWSEILAYASRDSYKTLGASILETLAVLHLERSSRTWPPSRPRRRTARST